MNLLAAILLVFNLAGGLSRAGSIFLRGLRHLTPCSFQLNHLGQRAPFYSIACLPQQMGEQFDQQSDTIRNTPSIIDSLDGWNRRVSEAFPNHLALRINQLDLLGPKANPRVAKFWAALRDSLHADKRGGAEGLHRVSSVTFKEGKTFLSAEGWRDNQDAKELWWLSAEGEAIEERQTMKKFSGFRSWELPKWRLEGVDPELRVPKDLLDAYKSEILSFILRERTELREILQDGRNQNPDSIQVVWEHKIIRRTFDGLLAAQPHFRFHRDTTLDDLRNSTEGLCVLTVITVIDNCDPLSTTCPELNSLESAGTVFRLDALFGSGKLSVDRQRFFHQEKPRHGDGFLYWYSRSVPGTATIFNNCEEMSSLMPQLTHSVAEVKPRKAIDDQDQAKARSRTILQTKVGFFLGGDLIYT